MLDAMDVDFDAEYTVDGYKGIAWRIHGWVEQPEFGSYFEDGEWWEDPLECGMFPDESGDSGVKMHMVGDDREFIFQLDEITKLNEPVCSCGQIGCEWDV